MYQVGHDADWGPSYTEAQWEDAKETALEFLTSKEIAKFQRPALEKVRVSKVGSTVFGHYDGLWPDVFAGSIRQQQVTKVIRALMEENSPTSIISAVKSAKEIVSQTPAFLLDQKKVC